MLAEVPDEASERLLLRALGDALGILHGVSDPGLPPLTAAVHPLLIALPLDLLNERTHRRDAHRFREFAPVEYRPPTTRLPGVPSDCPVDLGRSGARRDADVGMPDL